MKKINQLRNEALHQQAPLSRQAIEQSAGKHLAVLVGLVDSLSEIANPGPGNLDTLGQLAPRALQLLRDLAI